MCTNENNHSSLFSSILVITTQKDYEHIIYNDFESIY